MKLIDTLCSEFFSPQLLLPLVTEHIEGLQCKDHLTFVVHPDNQAQFEDYWRKRGFIHRSEWETVRFPGKHIALTLSAEGIGCDGMIGLSVPPDMTNTANPLVRTLKLYGTSSINTQGALLCGKPQHVAYQLEHGHVFSKACSSIEALGFEFICPELQYRDKDTGATLKQRFFTYKQQGAPWGTFAEVIQRIPGKNGEPYDGFEPSQIDDLYHHFNEWSLERLQAYR